jgi:hypothetical protein
MRITPAKLRAQRANARLSTGPRSEAGRRRSAQNSRRLPLSRIVLEDLERHGVDLAEVRRLWHDVMAVFWFIDPDCHYYLQRVTLSWWRKLDTVRRGESISDTKYAEGDIEKYLRMAVERFAKRRQRWERWLSKELGADVREGMGGVRVAVESRLGTLQRAVGLTPPRVCVCYKRTQKPHITDSKRFTLTKAGFSRSEFEKRSQNHNRLILLLIGPEKGLKPGSETNLIEPRFGSVRVVDEPYEPKRTETNLKTNPSNLDTLCCAQVIYNQDDALIRNSLASGRGQAASRAR